MFVASKEFAGALKAARMFASEDETRSHLNCVHLEAQPGALRIVSTDGHTMWCCEIPARSAIGDGAPLIPRAFPAAWNVALTDVDALIRMLKDAGEIAVDLDRMTVGTAVQFTQRSADFPPYTQVLPTMETLVNAKPDRVLLEFTAQYVARCCDALTTYSKGFAPIVPKGLNKWDKKNAQADREGYMQPPLAWRVGSELDPAIFYSPKFPAALAVVMPRKGNGDNSVAVSSFLSRIKASK